MEVKKSPKANLESKKAVFTQIGLVVVLSIVLIAFEWTWSDYSVDIDVTDSEASVEEEIIPITRQDDTPPPPPPPPAAADILSIVENDAELDAELEIFDSELDQAAAVDFNQVYQIVEDERDESNEIFVFAEEMPEFPGGQVAMQKFIAENIKYPVIAKENRVQGRVYVEFVVNEKGAVTNPRVMRGVDPNLDREALRVVQAMPNWKPGKQRNKAVKVSITLPVNFKIE